MKTVQLLYSYLLVEKPFTLESQPSSPTKEKRFAYKLYLDFIYLMDRLSHQVKGKNKSYPLSGTRFILRTEEDEKIKSLASEYEKGNYPFKEIEEELKEKIQTSLLFQEFEKNRNKGETTENFWENIFNSLIIVNPEVNEIVKSLSGYSLSGVERMRGLMNDTFKNFYSSKDNINDALKNLEVSLEKARDLYMRLLALPVELIRKRKDQLELNRRKILATEKDLNPNMNFVNNKISKLIEQNPYFDEYTQKNHLSWQVEDPELLEILLKGIIDSDIYSKYEALNNPDISQDSEFWQDVLVEIILNNKVFLEYLENKSVFWNDDLEIMSSFVIKTFKRLENPDTVATAVLPKYKDGENGRDAQFGAELFRYVVMNKELYRKYIQDALSKDKWEADRLAFMDVVILMTALAEIINYPEIPVTVSINEYIEIAKSYSSSKSGQFIHGLLASILPKLEEEKLIQK